MAQPPYGGFPGYPPPNPYYRAMAPKPGCIPLRPLDVHEILGGAVAAIRRHPRTVLMPSAAVAAIQAVLALVLQRYSYVNGEQIVDQSDPANPVVHWHVLSKVLYGTLGVSLVGGLFAAVLTGMVVMVVTEDVVGRSAGLDLVWSKVRSRIWRLIALSLLLTVVQGLALLLCVAPGVWLWGVWAVAVPALIIENRGIGGALGRSRGLVRGTFWRVWGIRALGYLVGGVLITVVGMLAGALTGYQPANAFGSSSDGSLSWAYSIVAALGTGVAATFTAPFLAGVDSLLYVDLRMRKENLTVELQQAAAGVRQPPRPPR